MVCRRAAGRAHEAPWESSGDTLPNCGHSPAPHAYQLSVSTLFDGEFRPYRGEQTFFELDDQIDAESHCRDDEPVPGRQRRGSEQVLHGGALIAPAECEGHEWVRACIEAILAADKPVAVKHHLDVRESMRNGGSPACLRHPTIPFTSSTPLGSFVRLLSRRWWAGVSSYRSRDSDSMTVTD